MLPLDQYMLARTRELTEKVLAGMRSFEFHRIYHAINEFCDCRSERAVSRCAEGPDVYLCADEPERRSAQTALWKITEALVRLVAPILSFTADEVWEYMPKAEGRVGSVHLAEFPGA